MHANGGSRLVLVELGLAALVGLVAIATLTDVVGAYPTWPTLGGVPVDPELVVPATLALVALVRSFQEGLTVGAVSVGGVALVTGWLAAVSWYSLFAGTAGGVFWGGLVTIVAGVALAVAVAVRAVTPRVPLREVFDRRKGSSEDG